MEEQDNLIIKDLQEKINALEIQIKDLKDKLKNHNHDGHGYSVY